jgi:hypothetical protein
MTFDADAVHSANSSSALRFVPYGGSLRMKSVFIVVVGITCGQIRARRNDTAFSATMIEESDISSAETSGRSDQPKRV